MPKKTKTTTQTSGNGKYYPVRGNSLVGKVISAKAPKTVTVEREIVVYVSKYERYKKLRSRVHAHNPEWINAKENDIVRIGETRKISKTKAFVITEILGHSQSEPEHEEMKEGTKLKHAKEEAKAEESE
ncbi:MAG: 30S ribosomal protein S17 [Candidatus Diapherotrites archaeon]